MDCRKSVCPINYLSGNTAGQLENKRLWTQGNWLGAGGGARKRGQMDYSESMHLDGGFLHSVLDKERGDLGTLVSLQLDYLAHLFVVNNSAIASEFLHNIYKSVNKSKRVSSKVCGPSYRGEHLLTFLKALRSFFWSYSAKKEKQ